MMMINDSIPLYIGTSIHSRRKKEVWNWITQATIIEQLLTFVNLSNKISAGDVDTTAVIAKESE